jgi:2-methylcitrate dehydratase PrpD
MTAELAPFYLSPLIHHRPSTGLEGKFSIEYALAASILDGRVALASLTDEMVRRPEARRLVEKSGARANSVKGQGVAATHARVIVELNDGSRLVQEVPEPRGAAGNPMSDGEIEAKFLDCWNSSSGRVGSPGASRALELLWHLDRLDGVAELAEVLA